MADHTAYELAEGLERAALFAASWETKERRVTLTLIKQGVEVQTHERSGRAIITHTEIVRWDTTLVDPDAVHRAILRTLDKAGWRGRHS